MNSIDYIDKGEDWCIEHADMINWEIFECDMTVFSSDFVDAFHEDIKTYVWTDKNWEPHRDDGPAIIKVGEYEVWCQHGQVHRDGGPARTFVEWSEAWRVIGRITEQWLQNGKLHRDGGPAQIFSIGTCTYYRHGKKHRDDGPACIGLGHAESWWVDGKRHREDGPAVTMIEGIQQWWINGFQLTELEFYETKRLHKKR